jgi:hypothetical protein
MSTANTIRVVHLRRALLLFAIVLGMAALVASLSRPVDQRKADTAPSERPPTTPPVAGPAPGSSPAPAVEFDAARNRSVRLPAGDAVTIEVSVAEAGSVDIPDLGLSAAADPVTPARFEVLPTRPGRYELLFTPAGGEPSEPAGRLVVTSAG